MPKKQKDGRYRSKIVIGHTTDGEAIAKYVSGRTKRELEEAKAEARAYYVDGAIRREDMLFSEYAVMWYEAKKRPHLSDSSRKSYASYLNKHIIPAFGDRMMRAVQPLEIQSWLNQYAGKSKTLITDLMSAVRGIFASATTDNILDKNPALNLIRPTPAPPVEKRAFTDEECAIIEKVIAKHEYGVFMAVLYYTGMRRGEALGLQWGDFDWKKGLISVRRDIDYADASGKGAVGPLKSDAAYREIPIEQELASKLKPICGVDGVFLFGEKENEPLNLSTFLRRWMSLMIDCGFAHPAKPPSPQKGKKPRKRDLRYDWECDITPHCFRHHYATVLYNAGVDPVIAMRILGHADYATTVKIYTHLDEARIADVANVISKGRKNVKKVAEKLPEQTKDESRQKTKPPKT